MNLGYLSNGPLLYLATFNEYAKDLEPNNVFFMYWEGNDIWNLYEETQSKTLMNYLNFSNFSQDLKKRQNEINLFWENIIEIDENMKKRTKNFIIRLATFSFIREYFKTLKLIKESNLAKSESMSDSVNEKNQTDLKKILMSINEKITIYNGKLHFVYLPDYQRFLQKKSEKKRHRRKGEVINLVKSLNIHIIDISNEFEKLNSPHDLWPFKKDQHYNEKGYKLIGEILFDNLNL